MANTNAAVVPVEHDHQVELTIVPSRQPDNRWNQQLDLIRNAGADFDPDSRSWYLPLDDPVLSTPGLEPLWRAVLEYGTTVRITMIKPQPQR